MMDYVGPVRLSPCPRCKDNAHIRSYGFGASEPNRGVMAVCDNDACGNAGPFSKSDETAADGWNARAALTDHTTKDDGEKS